MTSLVHRVWRPARSRAPAEERNPTTSEQDGPDLAPEAERTTGPTFATLPTEIHLLIAEYLTYPDALSLKHTNRHFYYLVDTGIKLKVEWLMERRMLHLECPNDSPCDLGSDLRFCRGSVKLLMQRRREHIECESRPGLGCLIYGTSTCPHGKKLKTRIKRWMRIRGVEDSLRWALLAFLVPLFVGWVWMARLIFF
ncbi:hypothetical protein VTK56DRAFT_4410 [Thermocarpiscus australiensis]